MRVPKGLYERLDARRILVEEESEVGGRDLRGPEVKSTPGGYVIELRHDARLSHDRFAGHNRKIQAQPN
jgi:hypothetical protein